MSYKAIDHSRREYELTQERQEAMGKLASKLGQAEAQNLHGAIGLPDIIRAKYIEDIPNYRSAVKRLLEHLLEEKGGQVGAQDGVARQLIQEIIDGIQEVDRISAELKKKPEDDDVDPKQNRNAA